MFVSLAMLTAKYITIYRKQRWEKGGVFDLAQDKANKKNKFKIKNFKVKNIGQNSINPKYKEKAEQDADLLNGRLLVLKYEDQKSLKKSK